MNNMKMVIYFLTYPANAFSQGDDWKLPAFLGIVFGMFAFIVMIFSSSGLIIGVFAYLSGIFLGTAGRMIDI
jgi:hypothetical protein